MYRSFAKCNWIGYSESFAKECKCCKWEIYQLSRKNVSSRSKRKHILRCIYEKVSQGKAYKLVTLVMDSGVSHTHTHYLFIRLSVNNAATYKSMNITLYMTERVKDEKS